MLRSILGTVVLLSGTVQLPGATPDQFFRSIRAGDMTALKQLAADGAAVNTADARGTTPLHFAAAYGTPDPVKLLLDAGAEVNRTNAMGATPLVLGASSPAKVRLLLAAGADPNIATKAGRTPLIIAAGRAGGFESVKALLAAGAKIDAADEMGITAILTASYSGDIEAVRLLLDKGAPVNATDKAGFTPLLNAVTTNDIVRVRLLLAKGADPNAANRFGGKVKHGNIALTNMTPVLIAATHGSVDMVRALIQAGGKVNVADGRGLTPLMAAAASENQDANVIRALLDAGADANATDIYGASVLDWARRAGYPSTAAILASAGAKAKLEISAAPTPSAKPVTARAAVEQGAALLSRSSTEFFRQSGCVGCHHQPVAAQAVRAATASGITIGSLKDELMRAMNAMRPIEPVLLQFIDVGGEVDTVGTALAGFAAAGIEANPLTDATVNYIAGKQNRNGSWTFFGITRPPFEESTITRTALAARALRQYGWPARQAEWDERVSRARTWLLKAEPRTSYERADLLLGLYWSGAKASELARVAGALIRDQRADGGWAQNKHVGSDAYATGLALYALHESGQLQASSAGYKRGVDYLLRTRLADGSWYVASRAPKFQPYFESGFPHGHDQWISATATAYAVMALAPAAQAPVTAAARN
jgi:ankyrin repeat protein